MAKLPEPRLIEKVFNLQAQFYNSPVNRIIQWIFVPLMLFSVLGIAWSVPFPHLGFLGRYNAFVNWASFLIALLGYYYYRLSPVLCYGFLIIILVLSMGVTMLENAHLHSNWPAVWKICSGLLIISVPALFAGYNSEGKKLDFLIFLKLLLAAPAYLISLPFRKGNIRY